MNVCVCVFRFTLFTELSGADIPPIIIINAWLAWGADYNRGFQDLHNRQPTCGAGGSD